MAAALYNKLAHTHDADSAGTAVQKPGQTLLERKRELPDRAFTIDVMDEIGIDVRNNKSTQLTQEMLDKYDLVVSMVTEQYAPDWLIHAPNYLYWDVDDPKGISYELTAKARDIIRHKVEVLISSETPVRAS